MIENKELGIKIAENTNESFWTDMKEKCEQAIESEKRNLKINRQMIELCEKELS